jgi:5'-nucleotidase (lipoprotein e(P4) family)
MNIPVVAMRTLRWAIGGLLACSGCAHAAIEPGCHESLQWATHSAEHEAALDTVYNSAYAALDAALQDPAWTALPEQKPPYGDLPPAILCDIDDTLLDSSSYQLLLYEAHAAFEPSTWARWVSTAPSGAFAAAVRFLTSAARRGVKVFYVSNSDVALEGAVRRRLSEGGFPLEADTDTVLMEHEQPDWGDDKSTRRRYVAAHYRIVLLFGDQLSDFMSVPDAGTALTEEHDEEKYWGRRWFLVPNPMYGSWRLKSCPR